MKLLKSNINYFASFLISSTLILYPIVYNLVFFETNDDFGMMLLAEGSLTGKYESELVHTSKLLGKILNFFYTHNQEISWYPILLSTCNFFALFLSLNLIFENTKKIFSRLKRIYVTLFLTMFLVLSFFEFTYSYQFTKTAVLASGIGFVYSIFGEKKYFLISYSLIFLGILWRPKAALVTILFISIIFLFNEIIKNKKILFHGRLIILASYVILLMLTIFLLDNNKSEFNTYNQLRGEIFEYSASSNLFVTQNQAKELIDWSYNDYDLFFFKGFYADIKVYSLENLRTLIEFKNKQSNFDFYGQVLRNLYGQLTSIYSNFLLVNLSFVLIVFIYFFINKKFLFCILFILYSKIYFLILYLSLLQGKLPERFLNPINYIFIFTMIILLFQTDFLLKQLNSPIINKSRKKTKFKSYYILAFLIFSFILSTSFFTKIYNINGQIELIKSNNFKRNLDPFNYMNILKYDEYEPIIAFPSFYSPLMQMFEPFDSLYTRKKFFSKTILIGSNVNSTAHFHQINKYKLDKNILLNLINKKATLGVGEILEVQRVNQFIIEKYDQNIIWPKSPTYFSDNGIQVWILK